MKKMLVSIMMVVAMMMAPVVAVVPAWAECKCTYINDDGTTDIKPGVEVNLVDLDGGGDDCYCPADYRQGTAIMEILVQVVNILSGIVMVAAVLGMLIVGIQYLTARDNEGQVMKAKMRLLQIVIGIAVFALMWVFLQWIIPGGIVNRAI